MSTPRSIPRTLAPADAPSTSFRDSHGRQPLRLRRTLNAYLMEAKFETLGALRTTGFALPFLIVPVAIYVLFGVVIIGNPGSSAV